jgi:hypothetical protein
MLKSYLEEAKREYTKGIATENELYGVAKSLRSFTRVKVKVGQIINVIYPPPLTPDELCAHLC